MMPRFLGESGNSTDKLYRGGEIIELIRPRNHRAFLFPIRHGGERGFDLRSAEFFHEQQMAQVGRIANGQCLLILEAPEKIEDESEDEDGK